MSLKFSDLDDDERRILRDALTAHIESLKEDVRQFGNEDSDRKAFAAATELRDYLESEGAL